MCEQGWQKRARAERHDVERKAKMFEDFAEKLPAMMADYTAIAPVGRAMMLSMVQQARDLSHALDEQSHKMALAERSGKPLARQGLSPWLPMALCERED